MKDLRQISRTFKFSRNGGNSHIYDLQENSTQLLFSFPHYIFQHYDEKYCNTVIQELLKKEKAAKHACLLSIKMLRNQAFSVTMANINLQMLDSLLSQFNV